MTRKPETERQPVSVRPATELTSADGSAEGLTVASNQAVSQDDIRAMAYLKWEAAGKPEGDGIPCWLEAERELLQAK